MVTNTSCWFNHWSIRSSFTTILAYRGLGMYRHSTCIYIYVVNNAYLYVYSTTKKLCTNMICDWCIQEQSMKCRHARLIITVHQPYGNHMHSVIVLYACVRENTWHWLVLRLGRLIKILHKICAEIGRIIRWCSYSTTCPSLSTHLALHHPRQSLPDLRSLEWGSSVPTCASGWGSRNPAMQHSTHVIIKEQPLRSSTRNLNH